MLLNEVTSILWGIKVNALDRIALEVPEFNLIHIVWIVVVDKQVRLARYLFKDTLPTFIATKQDVVEVEVGVCVKFAHTNTLYQSEPRCKQKVGGNEAPYSIIFCNYPLLSTRYLHG